MLDFNNLKNAFADKSDRDLKRAYILFKTLNYPLLSQTLTFLLKTAIWIKLPVKNIIRSTIYKQFCGGTTIQDSQNVINQLWKAKIGTILDFSIEGKENEKDFERTIEQTLESIQNAKDKESIPFCVFKPTGLAKFSLLEKMSAKKTLNKQEKLDADIFRKRMEKICKSAYQNKVPLFIDAEESWIQNIIDEISENMMEKFNKKEAWIYNTIQLYRKDRIIYLNNLLEKANKKDFILGVKIVRGAYYEKEVKRAQEKNYPCPVHEFKYETDRDYNKALEICIRNINRISICAGTHNEKSSLLLSNLLKEYDIGKNDKRVYFSQLLGMSDHISYNSSINGYNVAKYVPYGPIKELLPYLIRRAKENTSITGQVSRELINIKQEIQRRKKKN